MSALELRVPPLAQVLIAALAMWALDNGLPQYSAAVPAGRWLLAAYGGLGVLLALAGVLAFRRAQTTVDPRTPARASELVTAGIYRFSRNPMYLGMLFVLLGWFLYLGSLPSLLVPVLFVIYMTRFQIRPEERHIRALFGERYDDYCARVPRWI